MWAWTEIRGLEGGDLRTTGSRPVPRGSMTDVK